MPNPTVTRLRRGPTGTLQVICGSWMYEFPVASATVLAALSTPATLTNPTPVPDGWSSLTLTPADNITAALNAAGPEFTLTLAPGRYQQTITTPPDTTAWDILPNGPKDGVILHDFEVAR